MGSQLAKACISAHGTYRRRSSSHRRNSSNQQPREPPKFDDAVSGGDSYAAHMRIDNEVLAECYRRRRLLETPDQRSSYASASSRRRSSSNRRPSRVTFRTESFDSQASTESERREFRLLLVDSLPETFLDAVVKETPSSVAGVQSTALPGGPSDQSPPQHRLQVSAQISNEYVADVDEVAVEGGNSICNGTGLSGPGLSNSGRSNHTYESIGSRDLDGPSLTASWQSEVLQSSG